MIERLNGICVRRKQNGIIVDVNGVGYGVEMPLGDLCQIKKSGEPIEVWIYTMVREDALRLFGFLQLADREVFEILLSVNGIGPRIALAILSTLNVDQIERAIASGRCDLFESVPGIGSRMAEKIAVELKSKLKKLSHLRLDGASVLDQGKGFGELCPTNLYLDVESALANLGFKPQVVKPILSTIVKENRQMEFHDLLKMALVRLSTNMESNRPVSKDSQLAFPEG